MKVISFGALCDREVILSMLDKAVNDGHWLVFNNCHLLKQWDDKVVARISWLISSFRGRWSINNQFKLHLYNLLSLTNSYNPSYIYVSTYLPFWLPTYRGGMPDSPVLPFVVYNSRICIALHTR